MRGNFSTLLPSLACGLLAGPFWLSAAPYAVAQVALCPSGFSLTNGSCTNGKIGAFSGAALASQALSELTQSTAQETVRNSEQVISERREREIERCAEGYDRVDGECQRKPQEVVEAPAPAPLEPKEQPRKRAKTSKAARRTTYSARPAVRRPSVVYAPAPVPIEPAVRFGAWANVYGDYEKRDATGAASQICCRAVAATPVPNEISAQSRSSTIGFDAGADWTLRGLFAADDGIIAGVMVGYISTVVKLNTASYSSNTSLVPNGSAFMSATLSGPTTGLYTTYFNKQFSADALLKVDVLNVNQSFNDNLAFAASSSAAAGFISAFSGSGSASLLSTTLAGNLNYRFDIYPNFWIQPTVGAEYTNSSYGSGAYQLGLTDSSFVMIQGGARIGTTYNIFNNIRMTSTLTGLAYDDVLVTGGLIQGVNSATSNLLTQADQGQVRGRGVLALNFDFGQGLSSFVQGDVYGGKGLFGAGGKAGLRYQW